jgi:transcriptional regulatory protein RtcR
MKTVAIGFLGTMLDQGMKEDRWDRWRPTISLCAQDDLVIDRLELLTEPRFHKLTTQVIEDIQTISPETEVVIHHVHARDPWDFQNVYGALDDFAQTYPFDPDNETYLTHITTGTHVAQICMFLLTETRRIPGKLIQTSPAKRKKNPSGNYSIIDLDLSRYDRLAMRMQQQANDDISFLKSGIATRNARYNQLIEQLENVAARSTAPILLMGPTGAGKSFLARRIYELKKAKAQVKGAFIDVNCATLLGGNALSTLFGHKKGSFTGALQNRKGLLYEANEGLLFLDEIGDLGLDEQAMLLKAIEEKKFYPLGSDTESESDFQLICGTNRDLSTDAVKGRFREDLLARINLWTFELPSLKGRPEDIAPNLQFELDRHTQKSSYQVRFNKEAREKFLQFAQSPEALWTANFRDLNNAVTRMATLSTAGRITRQLAEEEIERLRAVWQTHPAQSTMSTLSDLLTPEELSNIDPFDQIQLNYVIETCLASPNLSEAGRTLFSASRRTRKTTNDSDRLRKYLHKFGLSWSSVNQRAS